jgi:hypothetical protein
VAATTIVSSKTTTGPSDWVRVRAPAKERTFQVSINGIATVSIEASNDGVNAVPLETGISSSTGYLDDGAWEYVRANITAVTSGSVTVVMGEKV